MTKVKAHITGNLWKIVVKVGQTVAEGETLVIMESMKMEIPVEAPSAGKVHQIVAQEGSRLDEGDVILLLDP